MYIYIYIHTHLCISIEPQSMLECCWSVLHGDNCRVFGLSGLEQQAQVFLVFEPASFEPEAFFFFLFFLLCLFCFYSFLLGGGGGWGVWDGGAEVRRIPG